MIHKLELHFYDMYIGFSTQGKTFYEDPKFGGDKLLNLSF